MFYNQRPAEEVCKELIQNLEYGMQGLAKFKEGGGVDSNTRVVKVVDETSGVARLEHQ